MAFSRSKLHLTSSFPQVDTPTVLVSQQFDCGIPDNWAYNVRRHIDDSVKSTGRPRNDDVIHLQKMLVKVIIGALQPNSSTKEWSALTDALRLIEPYTSYLNVNHGQALQRKHYIERLYYTYMKQPDNENFARVIGSLRKVFPDEVTSAEKKFSPTVNRDIPSRTGSKTPGIRQNRQRSPSRSGPILLGKQISFNELGPTTLPDGTKPYNLWKEPGSNVKRPQQVTVGDMRWALSSVAAEATAQECSWKTTTSSVVGALSLYLDEPGFTPHLDDGKFAQYADVGGERTDTRSPERKKLSHDKGFVSITGREAIELFSTQKHIDVVEFMYFNYANSRHFRPYDLVSVPEDKVDQEHFVFSSFGVLHVYGNGAPSETMTLSEWNRMAVLWGIVSKLGFFKNFLLLKSMKHWEHIVRRQRLMKIRAFLQNNLVYAIPGFGAALMQILHLAREFVQLRILPCESRTMRKLPLTSFSFAAAKQLADADEKVELFFRLCIRIVKHAKEACFNELKQAEFQMQHEKPLFSKESMYIQRKKRQIYTQRLEKAKNAVRQLSTFVSLVSQIIFIHVQKLCRLSVEGFVNDVLAAPTLEPEDDNVVPTTSPMAHSNKHGTMRSLKSSYLGHQSSISSGNMSAEDSVLVTEIIYNAKTNSLEMHPSLERFRSVIASCVPNAISALCINAESINDAKVQNDFNSPRYNFDKESFSSDTKSTDQFSIGSTASHDEREIADPLLSQLELDGQDGVEDSGYLRIPVKDSQLGLTVTGGRVIGELIPLDYSKWRSRLSSDVDVVKAVALQDSILDSALEEVKEFCVEQTAWFSTICDFTLNWNNDSISKWRGKPAREIEIMLNQIKAWSDKVKNMDRYIKSSNNLVIADCRKPLSKTISTLSNIFKQLINLIITEAKSTALEVVNSSKESIRLLENKDLGIKSFASYARKVKECHQMKDEMADKVRYIRELYEVLRMTHRQLTHEEERSEEKVKNAWESFMFQLKDATNFASNQQPLILKQLENIFNEKYEYIKSLMSASAMDSLSDPDRPATEVLSQLKNLIMKFSNTRRQLSELSLCRKAIEGKEYDLSELNDMALVLDTRLELWKYVSLSAQQITEWKNTLFRRFNASTAMGKINDWKKASLKLEERLPATDPVLLAWNKMVSDMSLELPLLKKMGNLAMKTRHWKKIFTGLGENYEPGWAFNVRDMLSFQLSDHEAFINQVCHGATAEYALEQMMKQIKSKWEDRQFNLAKHIHILPRKPISEAEGLDSLNQKNKKMTILDTSPQEIDSGTYVLVGSDDLLTELSDSHVMLQGMLQSRYATEVRTDAEVWNDAFQQIADIIDLWTSCQDKWKYLNMVYYSGSFVTAHLGDQIEFFHRMDRRYREFVKAVVHDPNVLSILSRRHGQLGWRELQGENLRKHILSCIHIQEMLLSSVSHLLDEFRSQFPRMYFLCDEDCIRLLSITREPKLFSPYVRKCFAGVKSLTYVLPSSEFSTTASNNLDRKLLAHKLEVTKVQGHNSESICFDRPLPMQLEPLSWMKMFQRKLESSLERMLGTALRTHTSRETEFSMDEDSETMQSRWLFRFPTQIVLLADSILWTNKMSKVLENWDSSSNYQIEAYVEKMIKKYSHIVRNLSITDSPNKPIMQSLSSVVALLAQVLYQRDVIQNLKQNDVTSENFFEWQRLLKYSVNMPLNGAALTEVQSVSNLECQIKHFGVVLDKYGMEYESLFLDSSSSSPFGTAFAMTPLSERSVVSLCLALQLDRCGILVGPNATGKTSILKHMSHVFGRPLINFNTSSTTEMNMLLRALSGVVESQCWLCFDQVENLPPAILSTLAQQIQNIQYHYSILRQSNFRLLRWEIPNEKKFKRSNSFPCVLSSNAVKAQSWETEALNVSEFWPHNDDNLQPKSLQFDDNVGSFVLNGKLLKASARCGLFMTWSCSDRLLSDFPNNLKVIARSVAFLKPPMKKVAEIWLSSLGFIGPSTLAEKIQSTVKFLEDNQDFIKNSTQMDEAVTLRDVRMAILTATEQLKTAPIVYTEPEWATLAYAQEIGLSDALSAVFSNKLASPSAQLEFRAFLRRQFAQRKPSNAVELPQLAEMIQHRLQIDGLAYSSAFVEKIYELYYAINRGRAVILTGPAGCGKTTIHKTLAGSVKSMSGSEVGSEGINDTDGTDSTGFPKEFNKSFDVNVIFTDILSQDDLFGPFLNKSGVQLQGLLSKILKSNKERESSAEMNQSEGPSHTKRMNKWIVLDGELNAPWIECMNCLIEVNGSTRLRNLDQVSLNDTSAVIFEVSNLTAASPAILSRCEVINCHNINLWEFVAASWLDSAYSKFAVTHGVINVWREMLNDLVPQTLGFLQHLNRNVLNHGICFDQKAQYAPSLGIPEISAFLQLLNALMSINLSRSSSTKSDDDDKEGFNVNSQTGFSQSPESNFSANRSQLDKDIPEYHFQLSVNYFAFAFIWAFGGSLLEEDLPQFNVFFRNLLSEKRITLDIPVYENVFEYFVDTDSGFWTLWEDKIDLRVNLPMEERNYENVHQIERYAYISGLLVESESPALILGDRGCGKSSMIMNLLAEEHAMSRVPISAGMTPWHLQKLIESRSATLKQHNIGLMVHPNAAIDTRTERDMKCLFFLDDLSCAPNAVDRADNSFAIQPIHALVRQILSTGALYDQEHQIIQTIKGKVNFVAASTSPGATGSGLGYSSHMLSPRLTRLFTPIHFLKPSRDAILSIYHNSVQSWLEEFPAYSLSRHYDLSQAIIAGAYEIYSTVKDHFKPTPSRPTHLFSLHDIAHVMQGMFLLTPKARGRPKPMRKRMPAAFGREDGNIARPRPMAGRPGRRIGGRPFGEASFGNSAMMRTIIRLWLHECCRTFSDRLTHSDDKLWISDLVFVTLKKHFCQEPSEGRAETPGYSKNFALSPPVPSGISSRTATSSSFTSSIDNVQSSPNDESQVDSSPNRDGAVTEDENGLSSETPERNISTSQEGTPISNIADTEDIDNTETGSASLPNAENDEFSEFSAFQDDDASDEDLDPQSTRMSGEFESDVNDEDSPDSPISSSPDSKAKKAARSKKAPRAETATESTLDSIPNDDRTTGMDNLSSTPASTAHQVQSSAISMKTEETPRPSGATRAKRLIKRPVHGRPGGAKHGVSFVPGLIDDPSQGANAGPLATVDQILSPGENPSNILFSKCVLSDGKNEIADYCESSAEDLATSLLKAQEMYNDSNPDELNLVFFEQAIQHIARFSRVFSMSRGGNSLCISSTKFTGRKSLCQLAAFLCKSTLVHAKSNEAKENSNLRDELRKFVIEASKHAGLNNKSTILLIDESYANDIECLIDVCSIVKEGSYPSLYTNSELADVAADMSTDTGFISMDSSIHRQPTGDKMDRCLQLYFRRVVTNLHVAVMMNLPSVKDTHSTSLKEQTSQSSFFHHNKDFEMLHGLFKRCPEFLTRFASIDFYQPWSQIAWMKLTTRYIENIENADLIPWPMRYLDDHVAKTCLAMSKIHQDSIQRLQATLPKSYGKLIKPLTVRTMVDLFTNISTKAGNEIRKLLKSYDIVLEKIVEAEKEAQHFAIGREDLIPVLQAAIKNERSWKRHVEQETREYSEAKDRCVLEENIIEKLEEDLVHLRHNTKIAFDEANPLYSSAVEAMRAVTVQDIDELKRYKSPPDSAVTVVKVLCEIFDVRPGNWENGKALILQENFFERIEFYDKDNVPEPLYRALSKHVKDPDFQPSVIGKGSKAAESLCTWVHAIHTYAKMCRFLAPKIQKVKDAEANMRKAQATLGVKRVRCYQIREELDNKIQKHKDAYAKVKKLEHDLEDIDSKITKSQILMGNLAEHANLWRDTRDSIQLQLDTIVGDSLLAAACLTYHGMFVQTQRHPAYLSWIKICRETFEELGGDWSPPDKAVYSPLEALVKVSSNQSSCWPLVFDPDNELECWIKPAVEAIAKEICLTKNSDLNNGYSERSAASDASFYDLPPKVIICEADHPQLEYKLHEATHSGYFFFVTHVERAQHPVIQKLVDLRSLVKNLDYGEEMENPVVHSNFRVVLSTSTDIKYLEALQSNYLPLEFCCFVDFSISREDFEAKIVQIVMSHERPDFESHRKLLETDISHLKLQKQLVMQDLFDKVSKIEISLLSDRTLLEDIRSCKRETGAVKMAQKETLHMRANLESKLLELSEIKSSALALYDTLAKAYLMKTDFYCWPASTLLRIVSNIVTSRTKGKLYQPTEMSLKSRAAEIEQNMIKSVLQVTKATMSKQDYFTLTVILSLTKLENEGKLTPEEVESFAGVRNRLSPAELKEANSDDSKPKWMSGQMWMAAKSLEQHHPVFLALTQLIGLKQSLWQEYLFSEPVLLMNVPAPELKHLSLGQKALMWKTMRPDRSKKIMAMLATGVLGNTSTSPLEWNVDSLLTTHERNVPVIFLVSDEVHHPLREIELEAVLKKIQLIQRSAPFDDDLTLILRRCMSEGHWLVLHECQVEKKWTDELVALMTTICQPTCDNYNRMKNNFSEVTKMKRNSAKYSDAASEITNKTQDDVSVEQVPPHSIFLHENFRLWLILSVDDEDVQLQGVLPETIIDKGYVLNLTSQTPLQDVAARNLELVNKSKFVDNMKIKKDRSSESEDLFATKLVAAHAIFLKLLASQKCSYPYTDISVIDFWKICQVIKNSLSSDDLAKFCKEFLQGNSRLADDSHFNDAILPLSESVSKGDHTNKFQGLMKYINEPCLAVSFMLKEREQGVSILFNRNKSGDAVVTALRVTSKYFSSAPQLNQLQESGKLHSAAAGFVRWMEELLTLVTTIDFPETSSVDNGEEQFDFFDVECGRISTAITLMKMDITTCVEALKGNVEINSEVLHLIESLVSDKIPKIWSHRHPEIFYFHSKRSVRAFIRQLQSSSTLVPKYKDMAQNLLMDESGSTMDLTTTESRSMQTPACFNLRGYLRPDLFLRFIMTSVLKDGGLDPEAYFESKVVPKFTSTSVNDSLSILVEDIWLHHANYNRRSESIHESASHLPSKLPTIILTPTRKKGNQTTEEKFFHCPVFHGPLRERNSLFTVKLKCEQDPMKFEMKDVYAFLSSF